MGIPVEDLEKPKIAVVNSSSQLSVCYSHLGDVSRVVQESIRAAGGLPFEIFTAAPSDFVTSAGLAARYLMPSRDLIVNDIEVAVEGAVLDGMVALASCDKTTPGQLMAAGRLNIPTIIVLCGYQVGGACCDRLIDIDDVYESIGSLIAGHMDLAELTRMTETAIQGPGVCAGLGTANTMHILTEALGMALPHSTPIRAGSERMFEFAEESGHRIVQMIAEGLTPRKIMSTQSFENAVMVDLAIGGSINSVRHLQAIAQETEVNVDIFALLEKFADQVPLLCGVRPNGMARTEDLESAGGTAGIMKRLESHLHLDSLSISGDTLAVTIEGTEVIDDSVIRTVSDPYSNKPGLILVRGSLAPEGALVKFAAVAEECYVFEGRARVFESEDEAIAALGKGQIYPGDVVILRGLGPKGGPGTVFAAGFVAALNGAGLATDIAVITDGELSGLNRGLTIGQVMPEAAEGGPLALVVEDDLIRIDLLGRTVDLAVEEQELQSRRSRWEPRKGPHPRGWLGIYAEVVQPLSKGAVLGDRQGEQK